MLFHLIVRVSSRKKRSQTTRHSKQPKVRPRTATIHNKPGSAPTTAQRNHAQHPLSAIRRCAAFREKKSTMLGIPCSSPARLLRQTPPLRHRPHQRAPTRLSKHGWREKHQYSNSTSTSTSNSSNSSSSSSTSGRPRQIKFDLDSEPQDTAQPPEAAATLAKTAPTVVNTPVGHESMVRPQKLAGHATARRAAREPGGDDNVAVKERRHAPMLITDAERPPQTMLARADPAPREGTLPSYAPKWARGLQTRSDAPSKDIALLPFASDALPHVCFARTSPGSPGTGLQCLQHSQPAIRTQQGTQHAAQILALLLPRLLLWTPLKLVRKRVEINTSGQRRSQRRALTTAIRARLVKADRGEWMQLVHGTSHAAEANI